MDAPEIALELTKLVVMKTDASESRHAGSWGNDRTKAGWTAAIGEVFQDLYAYVKTAGADTSLSRLKKELDGGRNP